MIFLLTHTLAVHFPICIDSKAIRPQGILKIELRQTVYGVFDLSFELKINLRLFHFAGKK